MKPRGLLRVAGSGAADLPQPWKSVTLTTDGACLGNPGPGGWACILRYDRLKRELWGSDPHTTNNRMELTAVIEGLRALKEPCRVTVVTDSQYVKNGITSWIHAWKRSGWKTAAGTPVLNRELWMALDEQAGRHEIHWQWVRGHAGHDDNERCDELAAAAARLARTQAAGRPAPPNPRRPPETAARRRDPEA